VDSGDVFDFAPAAGQTSVVAGGVMPLPARTLLRWLLDTNNTVYKSSVSIKPIMKLIARPREEHATRHLSTIPMMVTMCNLLSG